MHYFGQFQDDMLAADSLFAGHSQGYTRAPLVSHTTGSVHTGLSICELAPARWRGRSNACRRTWRSSGSATRATPPGRKPWPVTVTSTEGLDNLFALSDDATRAAWRACPTFAPHWRIAARARELGLAVFETRAGDAGLLAGLLEWAATTTARTS